MKIKNILGVILLSSITTLNLSAQKLDDKVIIQAMSDEIDRNFNGLRLQGQENPFFISYTFGACSRINITST